MNNAYSYMEQYFNSNIDLNDTTLPEVSHTTKVKEDNYKIPTPEGGQIYTDTNGEKVPIPTGFKYKEGTKNTGLAITDNANVNEFVWVPVPYVIAENEVFEEKTKDIITM